jgi:hypothetical protein
MTGRSMLICCLLIAICGSRATANEIIVVDPGHGGPGGGRYGVDEQKLDQMQVFRLTFCNSAGHNVKKQGEISKRTTGADRLERGPNRDPVVQPVARRP